MPRLIINCECNEYSYQIPFNAALKQSQNYLQVCAFSPFTGAFSTKLKCADFQHGLYDY